MDRMFGGREVRPSDVEDILCGSRDAPTLDEDPVASMGIGLGRVAFETGVPHDGDIIRSRTEGAG